MKLIVKNKGVTVIERKLTIKEMDSLSSFGAQFYCDAFREYLGINILDYRISEYKQNERSDEFTLFIRDNDLIKLRDNKLKKLGL